MYSQIGDIIFSGKHSFTAIEHRDTTTYAQHDLVNGKPILQPTGNDIEEFSIEVRLRAEFINPETARLKLKEYKDEYKVLPFIKGNGQYLGDFVITEIVTTHLQSLSDGTLIEANLSLTLREFVTADKLQQQQASARKQAFAVGDKKPVGIGALQPKTVAQSTAAYLAEAGSYSHLVDRKCSEYVNNVSKRQSIADKIQSSLQKMDEKLQSVQDALENIELLEDAAAVYSYVNAVRQRITNFTFPVTSLDDLRTNNRNLQLAVRNMASGSIKIINLVITRAA